MSYFTFSINTIQWMMKSPDNQFDMPRSSEDWNKLAYRSIKYEPVSATRKNGEWVYFKRNGQTFMADPDLTKVVKFANEIHYSNPNDYDNIDPRYDTCGYAMYQNLGEPEKRLDGSEYKKWDDDCTCNCK
tara:strand:- start:371 stop:760 length:390 start_codon:yes stop_codon:yes gene_type:complete